MAQFRWVKKYRTLEQIATAQERAVRFASNFLKDDDLADELESLTPEQYALRKGIVITDSAERRHNLEGGATKQQLEDCIDEASKILEDAYQPESTREDLVIAVGDALAALEGDMGEEEAYGEGGDDDSY